MVIAALVVGALVGGTIGWRLARLVIVRECLELGGFHSGGDVFVCKPVRKEGSNGQ